MSELNSAQAARLCDLVPAALELGAEDRAAFLRQACGADEELRLEVGSLLAHEAGAEEFLKAPKLADPFGTALADEGELHAGETLGDYRILHLLGEGGMGEVYLAEDTKLGRQVAIKLIKSGFGTKEFVRHFQQEERILAALNHPNIARLYGGAVTDKGLPFFVMEYVEGTPLTDYAKVNSLGEEEKLDLFRKVCAAVSYAHQNLVLHRDLKPANIRVTQEGEPKLLDFGIARLLDPDTAATDNFTIVTTGVMTPGYASPEQRRGERMTTASDTYSLGIVLYELLAGQKPHLRKDGEAGLKKRGSDLDNIVTKALRPEPERRYASVGQFSEDIRRYSEGLPIIARRDTLSYRASKFVGRNRLAVAAAAIILATVLSGIVMTVREKRKADRRFNDVRRMANSFIFEADDAIQKGPTQARAMIVRQALTYLDSLAREAGNDAGLQLELARGYLKVGDVQGKPYRPNIGDTAGALVSYGKARKILQALTVASPHNSEARQSLSLAWQSVGRVEAREGDWAAGLECERKAVAISEALVSAYPAQASYRALLADNYLHLGEALEPPPPVATIAELREPIAFFRKALAMHKALVALEPANSSYRYAMGVDYEYLGLTLRGLGKLTGDPENYRAALENHRAELKINEALAASDPANQAYRRILADVYAEIGHCELKLSRPAEALEDFRHTLSIFESVEVSDPTNVEARRDVAAADGSIAQALAQSGDLSAALVAERKAIAIYRELSAAEPANTEIRMYLLTRWETVGELLRKSGDVEGALESYHNTVVTVEAWSKAEPESVSLQRLLASDETNIAAAYKQMAVSPGLPADESRARWRNAQKCYQRSLDAWRWLRAHSGLTKSDEIQIAELTSDFAQCNVALAQRQ